MARIVFWLDEEKRTVDPTLFSEKAERLSKDIADECEKSRRRINKRTQIRRFYDEVVRLDLVSKNPKSDWGAVLPLVHMLVAKAAYAKGRELVSDTFVEFIRYSIEQVKHPKDLNVFAKFFEAFMGFYRSDCPVKS
ncbi:MAG: type III-A CRISPR-associated protein Csm2 [Desulfobacterales bacterium]|nr:type III-A CRISPR-associated protein Csm2 [Desulfobacterales bacterium]